ncbi:uncharacterized protein LOC116614431 [Nematostella vectensis]|uniref:uncharacterized protein LOC116614431 n=1 Tax=Nematostella vectensis TaxID=45351 RepID=UPI0013904329|nr:uncharacterized protein LOC116614431 [Nematostella vectensis]
MRYEFCVECSVCASENCQEHGRTGCGDQDCVHVLKCVHGGETPYRCDRVFGDGFYLPGLTRWFKDEVETQDYGIECCGIMIDGESDMEVLKDVVEQHKQEIINEVAGASCSKNLQSSKIERRYYLDLTVTRMGTIGADTLRIYC